MKEVTSPNGQRRLQGHIITAFITVLITSSLWLFTGAQRLVEFEVRQKKMQEDVDRIYADIQRLEDRIISVLDFMREGP